MMALLKFIGFPMAAPESTRGAGHFDVACGLCSGLAAHVAPSRGWADFEKILSTLNKKKPERFLADGWLFVCVKLAGVGWMFVSMLEGREPSWKMATVQ